ncbi:MAG: glycine cleavage system protein R [Candidatus Neomarinimicrobiota bacterium]|mgnify:CR=1 FL=1|tara:strand:- start:512 stop:1027 length:516 start_codon:yes stop_codon:yes gene_type:complete
MRSKLIISANGPDRKGIVSEISSIISNHSANIETSKMIRLEKEFAMLILIEVEESKNEVLSNALNQIPGLFVNLINTKNNLDILYENKLHLYINGADNEGIVYSFSNLLSELEINIDEVNTKIENAPMSATPLFMMDLVIGSKSKINIQKINEKLNVIAEKLGVEVVVKKF